MIGSFLTSGFILALGYAYPAYECYKVVDKNKPEIEQLRFWCQYWILVAVLTIFERLGGDAFISWLPMYSEAKLAFYIYLWYPKTRGTAYVYDTFFQPYVAKHEVEIDRSIMELRARAGDVAVLYMQKAAAYGQTRFFEILQYVASQSQPSRSRPAQRRQQETTQQQVQKPPPPIVPDRRAAVLSPPPPTQQTTTTSPPSPARGLTKEPDPAAPTPVAPLSPSKAQLAPATSTTGKPGFSQTSTEPSKGGCTAKPSDVAEESMQVDQVAAITTSKEDSSSSNANPNSTQNPKETVMEETLRVTRGRLRRARSITTTTTTTTTR